MKLFRHRETSTVRRVPALKVNKVHPYESHIAPPRNILGNETPRRLIIPKCSFDCMDSSSPSIREAANGNSFHHLRVKGEEDEKGAMLVLEQSKSSNVATKRYFIERHHDRFGTTYRIYLTRPVYKGQIPSRCTKLHTKLYCLAQVVKSNVSSSRLDVRHVNEGGTQDQLLTIRRAVSHGTKHIIKRQDGKPVATTHAWGNDTSKVEMKLGANASLIICLAFIADDVDSSDARWH